MDLVEAIEIVRDGKIAEEDTITFRAAVVIFIALDSDLDWDLDKLQDATGYDRYEISLFIKNLIDNKVLSNGKIVMEETEDGIDEIIGFTIISMIAAGVIVKYEVKEEVETIKIKTKMSKTLNEHLFDTLDRLADAPPEEIDNECNKAASIIAVSEQVLKVARLKLDILAAKGDLANGFAEIDALPSEETTSDKKKLQA